LYSSHAISLQKASSAGGMAQPGLDSRLKNGPNMDVRINQQPIYMQI